MDGSDKQIPDALERVSPERRRDAVLRLNAEASALGPVVDIFEPAIVELARERGLDWAQLPDDERQQLVDDILHESASTWSTTLSEVQCAQPNH